MSIWQYITQHPALKGAGSVNVPSGTDISNSILGGVSTGYDISSPVVNDLMTGIQDLDLDWQRQLYLTNLANSYNKSAQHDYQNWLESMSGSAYQRQVDDLKKAGYNPALVLGAGGAGVSSSGYSTFVAPSGPTTGAYQLKKSNTAFKYANLKAQNMRFVADRILKILDKYMPSVDDLIKFFG